MLTKRRSGVAGRGSHQALAAGLTAHTLDRRGFLRKSGLAAGGLAALGTMRLGAVRPAQAAGSSADPAQAVIRKNICTHCSVGCTVTAEVVNGVWVGQEPSWASPINRGAHCAKGAAIRELVHSDRRLRYPMKIVNGEWQRVSWDQAITEITDKLQAIRAKNGADSVYWLGSAKFTNEASYLFRKFAAYWGTNNVDHQARICHSTTVAGVANTWGYGAQTNSYNDIRNAKTMIILGGNPAEAHPISMQHVLSGKEINRANMIVIDPRFTRTAAHATEYVRIRSGTDIPVVWGILWHIFQNGWEDKAFIEQRVYAMDDVRKEVAKWTPDEVERVSGVPGEQLKRVAELFAKEKPATLIWCMGATQHTVGTANVRALCILCLATGNVGKPGTGANIFRGHTNVQGATDLGLDVTTLPLYYGLVEGGWKHWARVWEVEYDWLQSRFDEVPASAGRKARSRKENMETPGLTSTRWFDAVSLPPEQVDQRTPLKAMMVFGHGGNTVTRMPEAVKGMAELELLVVADPHPTTFAAMDARRDNTYLLPICTSLEMDGSRTASNRTLQWGEQVVKPAFESKNDYEVIYRMAVKLGFAESLFKNIKVVDGIPVAEDLLREINRGGWSTGYSGQSPERLKAHMKNQHKFDLVTLRAPKDDPEVGGDYYGLPWPCWGKPELKHPGTHILYNTSLHVKEGGSTFRARFGTERNGQTLLAEDSFTKDSDLTDGYPEFTFGVFRKLGWDKDLTEAELATIKRIGGNNPDAVSWATDLSGGIQRVCLDHGVIPFGNGKARANAWNLPDPVPVHREPVYSPRPDLVAKYPTRPDERQFRMPNVGFSVQKAAVDRGIAKQFPIILSSGRLVEYEGGGEETRSNPWLAELQQDMFVEVNTQDAAERGIKDGQFVWVYGPENSSKAKVKALVTDRVAKGVAWMPFHFSGWFQGKDMRDFYPKGADPVVLGESVNTVTTYGFDPVTGMQETKVTLCQISAA
ncbi:MULTISPECIES: formate dehydrogenase subunit alpha [Methylobacterium]|jgi:formate dehydrogenase major subunit|uniref:Formate dehydrogenase n=2 Tax=Methylobacterium TaxID=407 RepID=A0A0C6FQG3_9HYPH|nr:MULTISPECIES: formate dehydrogenase subunit alpha [Methylobacterium]MBZ6411878.1 formate dehydrogenase subunit alpha [Methylobacterium sp.]MBK3398185.1 formate dehydrogenase subunit alpha [Methylobacterium ajmalii]MBK3407479.1 formate dehydrogenase subunit alpha [Methylobacterium ajmalii]MBK3425786.1 formate dehydrogenase subunit alpha [Methylobacterium ajmalii]SFF18161.1 formate dehydrogenase major subunit [Methylobacterium sp. yr596]